MFWSLQFLKDVSKGCRSAQPRSTRRSCDSVALKPPRKTWQVLVASRESGARNCQRNEAHQLPSHAGLLLFIYLYIYILSLHFVTILRCYTRAHEMTLLLRVDLYSANSGLRVLAPLFQKVSQVLPIIQLSRRSFSRLGRDLRCFPPYVKHSVYLLMLAFVTISRREQLPRDKEKRKTSS